MFLAFPDILDDFRQFLTFLTIPTVIAGFDGFTPVLPRVVGGLSLSFLMFYVQNGDIPEQKV